MSNSPDRPTDDGPRQDGSRPDEIEGISTEPGATFGDPELRSVNAAPDLSDEREADSSDVRNVTPGDETPGTPFDPK